MKLVSFVFTAAALLLVAGFAYVAFTDIPVEQTEIVKTIPNDRFFSSSAP